MASDKRIILITGANNGIGFDTSYELAHASPNNHVIMAARSTTKGEKALADIQARKPAGTLSLIELDVTSDSSIAAAAKKIESDYGRLDVLVNNAGILFDHSVADTTRDILHQTFNTNVYGPMLLTNAVTHLLKKSTDPRIINVSSGLGSITNRLDFENQYSGFSNCEPYRMSKAALNMLTACQAFEFKDCGGKAFAYCPGYVVTDLSGPGTREWRVNTGAESSETSAVGIREIVEGQRDGETDKFVQKYGKQFPW